MTRQMIQDTLPSQPDFPFNAALLVGLVAFACIVAFTGVFQANTFDSDTIRAGAAATLRGENPYRDADGLSAYFNPPHSVLAYPLMLAPAFVYRLTLVLVVALAVYVFRNGWLALYCLTPAFIVHGIGANNIGLQVGVLGVVALWLAEQRKDWLGVGLTAWSYGLLLIKPQMGLGIVLLHLLWLIWHGRIRFLLVVSGMCALWFLVLPTLVGLVSGNRLIWLDWWNDVVGNRLFEPVSDIRINPETDMEPFVNRHGLIGALLLSGIGAQIMYDRHRFALIEVFQMGSLFSVIWTPYTDTLVVGLLFILTMTPRQILAYGFILWFLSLWIWSRNDTGDLYFLPEVSIYFMAVMLTFAGENRHE